MNLLEKSLAGIALMMVGFASAHASSPIQQGESKTPLSSMSVEQKKAEQKYFGSHSFEFSAIFKSHHPGPYWILENAQKFQLSSEQMKQQEDLKFGMAKSTIIDNTALQNAYKKYALDASVVAPSLALIKQDIEAIGKAQTQLALVMVPYHLKAYSALTPTQKTLYRKLVLSNN